VHRLASPIGIHTFCTSSCYLHPTPHSTRVSVQVPCTFCTCGGSPMVPRGAPHKDPQRRTHCYRHPWCYPTSPHLIVLAFLAMLGQGPHQSWQSYLGCFAVCVFLWCLPLSASSCPPSCASMAFGMGYLAVPFLVFCVP